MDTVIARWRDIQQWRREAKFAPDNAVVEVHYLRYTPPLWHGCTVALIDATADAG